MNKAERIQTIGRIDRRLDDIEKAGEKIPYRRIAKELDLDPDKGVAMVRNRVSRRREKSGIKADPEESRKLRNIAISEARGGKRFLVEDMANWGMASPEIHTALAVNGVDYRTDYIGAVVSKARKTGDFRQLTPEEMFNVRSSTDPRHFSKEIIAARGRVWKREAQKMTSEGIKPPQNRIIWMNLLNPVDIAWNALSGGIEQNTLQSNENSDSENNSITVYKKDPRQLELPEVNPRLIQIFTEMRLAVPSDLDELALLTEFMQAKDEYNQGKKERYNTFAAKIDYIPKTLDPYIQAITQYLAKQYRRS